MISLRCIFLKVGSRKPILWLATVRTKVRFTRLKGEHSSLNVHLRRVGVVAPTMLLLLIASELQLFNHKFYHNSSLDLNQQAGDVIFFVPNSQHQSTQSAAVVSTCQGCHQHQDPTMPAGSIHISEETALTQDKYLQEPQQNSDRGPKVSRLKAFNRAAQVVHR